MRINMSDPAFPVTWQDSDGQMIATPGMTKEELFQLVILHALICAGANWHQDQDMTLETANGFVGELEKALT